MNNLVNEHRPEVNPKEKFEYDHAWRSEKEKDFYEQAMPLDLRAGQLFLALDNLQEPTSQGGSSPEDTASSLITLSITNIEQQSEQ